MQGQASFWDERCDAAFVVYAIPIPSVRLSVTRVDCGHTVRPIETILVSLESPNILVSEKIRMVYIGHPKPFQISGRMESGSDRTNRTPPFPVYYMHYVDPLAGPHSVRHRAQMTAGRSIVGHLPSRSFTAFVPLTALLAFLV